MSELFMLGSVGAWGGRETPPWVDPTAELRVLDRAQAQRPLGPAKSGAPTARSTATSRSSASAPAMIQSRSPTSRSSSATRPRRSRSRTQPRSTSPTIPNLNPSPPTSASIEFELDGGMGPYTVNDYIEIIASCP